MKITIGLRRSTPGAILSTFRSFCLCAITLGALAGAARGANGVVYYNRMTTNTPATIR